MNIFAANYVQPIDPYKAISYFYNALSKDPYITGVWHDLGKIYANKYQYNEAWKCFGIMLNINPTHPMAHEILEKKKYLRTNYADYFK